MATTIQASSGCGTARNTTLGILIVPPWKKPYYSKSQPLLRCGLISGPERECSSRRLLSISLFASQLQFLLPNGIAGSLLDKYVKRKKLDPLEVYVPAVILTEMQIKDLGKTLDVDEPQFGSYRSILRSGPAGSLRVNIRAVAQYASDAGKGEAAFNDVAQCLTALEELDNLLLQASRNNPGATIKSMKAKIVNATNALDSLLNTVPPDVLDRGKTIADAYNAPEDEEKEEYTKRQIPQDPQLKQLESIL
ncbi:hypothetical protein LINPERPRIM_LOCUS37786 [Linum perenne]